MASFGFSASDWYNKIPTSLFWISKLDIFMIYGFSNPYKPVFTHFIIPKMLQLNQEKYGNILENIIFCNYEK